MPKPPVIDLPGLDIPIVYEDASVLIVDKPAGWILAPESWRTPRNLQRALRESMAAGAHWSRARNLKFIRFVHRLDAETSGLLMLAKSQGALSAFSQMFERREVAKVYWALAIGNPPGAEWSCTLKLGPDPKQRDRVMVDARHGVEAQTDFRVLRRWERHVLIEARPATGRTHQIRVHLAQSGLPVVGDELYGARAAAGDGRLWLRAVGLEYRDPFRKRLVSVRAAGTAFEAAAQTVATRRGTAIEFSAPAREHLAPSPSPRDEPALAKPIRRGRRAGRG